MDILLIILVIVAILLGVYLMVTLKKLNGALDTLKNDFEKLSIKLFPLIEELEGLTKKWSNITSEVEKQIDYVASRVDNVKEKISSLIAPVRSNPQESAGNLISNLKAIFRGISSFINELKK